LYGRFRTDCGGGYTAQDGVDAVVTTFNRTKYVYQAVQAIWRLIPIRRIFVVDGSTDPRAKLVMREVADVFDAEYLEGPVAIGGKVLMGAENAATEWILVCSDDTIVREGYWRVVREAVNERAGFIAPNAEHGFRFPWWREFFHWFTERPFVCAGSYVVRRDLVLECPELMDMNMSEDSYIRDHCVARGYDFVPLTERVALHDIGYPSELQQRKRAWEYGRSYGLLPSWKHTLRMSLKFALSKVRQIGGYSREKGFSLPVALFQMLQVAIMSCGTVNLWRPKSGRSMNA
jgi:hypothetical protein